LEIGIVLVIALVVFGPKKLPELGKSVGQGLREFRSSVAGSDDEQKEEANVVTEPTSKTQDRPV